MRIKVKWTSCGHRKQMALIVFYDYADGKRQAVGYICGQCAHAQPFDLKTWAHMSTTKVHIYRALYPDKVGNIRIVFARIAGAEDVLPDAAMGELLKYLDARNEQMADEILSIGAPTGRKLASKEELLRGISFAIESDAAASNYTRR